MSKMTDYTNKVVQLSADVTAIWKLQCKNLYNSKNLGALAIRECLQNSLDAIKSAEKAGKIKKGEGHIEIEINENYVRFSDNGIGMDVKTLHEKFLNLGGTTKGDKDNVGGFGLAKAVILGCGSGFEIHTQDNKFSSEDLGKNPISKTKFRQGTQITLYGVQTDKDKTIKEHWDMLVTKAIMYVESSEVEVPVSINGVTCIRNGWFHSTKKTRRPPGYFGITEKEVPSDTKLAINVYKLNNSSAGMMFIRLRGLTQFKKYIGWNSNCDIVLDIQTKINPRSSEYPFSTNREGLKSQYQPIIDKIIDAVTQSPLSVCNDDEWKEVIYDNANAGVEQARIIQSCVTKEQNLKMAKALRAILDKSSCMQSLASKIINCDEVAENYAQQKGIDKSQVVNPLKYSWISMTEPKSNVRLSKTRTVECIVAWDAILRLMATHYSGLDGKVFYPGVIVKENYLGMCYMKRLESKTRCFITFNPLETPLNNDSHTALYLMGVAAHELAHAACGTYEAHGETFSYTREAIYNNNLPYVVDIINIVKAGRIRSTISKLQSKGKDKTEQKSNYSNMSLEQVIDMAEGLGIDIKSYENKYSDKSILRMRLVMAIKKSM